MNFNTTALARAIARLDEGLSAYQRDSTHALIRDGLIQRFEFTYEISHKLIKRYFQSTAANPQQYDSMVFQDLIRSASEAGLLLGDWPAWRTYRDMRSKTSHTYDEAIAQEVVAGIPAFRREAQHLREQLDDRIAR
jgi:nucleotidyltransferase substrate binding protein (TIGR01987 family)